MSAVASSAVPAGASTRSARAGINAFLDDEYLTVAEVARRLSVSDKTVRRRMKDGTWLQGVVWFQPPGTHPRFSWKAVVAWQRGEG